MKSAITLKSIILWFLIVLGLYLAAFYGTEYWNHRNGPWEVEFVSDLVGNPSIVISQPKLNIANMQIVMSDEKVRTNIAEKMLFSRPVRTLPFQMPVGEVVYEDLRTLPGVVTFNLLGHEVELLPRVLIADKREIPWKSHTVVRLSATNKPPVPPKPPKGWDEK